MLNGIQSPCVVTDFYMLIKVQPDATVCRHLFTATSLYVFRVSGTHHQEYWKLYLLPLVYVMVMVPLLPSTVAWSGRVWASRSLKPVRIRSRWKEVTTPLPWHTPEAADTVFSTPDDGCVTPETCRVTWQWINVCILLHRVGPLLTCYSLFLL